MRYIRINKTYFTTTEQTFRDIEAEQIVAALKRPNQFAFEWAKSPDYSKQLGLFGTGNFADRAAQCERWVSGLSV